MYYSTTHLLSFNFYHENLMARKKKEREPLLRSKYSVHLEDLNESECKQWLEAMFYYKESWKILDNISSWVKAIIRRQIEEREDDKQNYQEECERQSKRIKDYWEKKKSTTVHHGIPPNTTATNSNSNILSKDNIKEEIIKEENDVREDWKKRYLKNVWLKEEEYNKLIEQYGKKIIEEYILRLNDYMVRKWRTYTDHYLTILKRLSKDNVKKKSEKEDKPIDSLKPTLSKPKLPWITKLKKDC